MPVAMTTSSEPEPERTERSTQDLSTHPTVEEMEKCDAAVLLRWIQRKKPQLRREYLDKFTAAGFLGEAFLRHAGDKNLFMEVGLPFGVSDLLANQGNEVKEESKFIPRT